MRKIHIDKILQNQVTDFCKTAFTGHEGTRYETPIIRLKKLRDKIQPRKHKQYREYVTKIINEYNDILKANPTEMGSLITAFNAILPYHLLLEKIPNKKKSFWESVVYAMRYEELRDNEFRKHLLGSSIKACVYCNSNLAITFQTNYYNKEENKRVKEYKAKLELDHFHPKSKYPFLCTSFYNLYPVCGNCNRAKSYNPVKFELYTTSKELDVFSFWIDDTSIIKYWTNKKREDIKVYFQTINGDIELHKDHNKTFDIQGIYDTQSDIVEELLHKAEVYNNSYNSTLVNNFKTLFPDRALVNRLVIGNYDKPEDIHKRPMAKFTQDIAKQLGLV